VVLAALLIPVGIGRGMLLGPWFWPATAGMILIAGFGLRDFVVDLKPFRIRRDPDHIHFRFTLRG
jgi:hypothetical protein